MTETTRRSRDSRGRFANEHEEAVGGTVVLAGSEGQTAVVEHRSGNPVRVTLGIIDEAAESVYSQGQCLALAVAASKRTGWPVVLHTFVDPEDDEEYENLRHAFVQHPDGYLIDIKGGVHGADGIADRPVLMASIQFEDATCVVPAEYADGLLEDFAPKLPEQNLAVADTFVEPMIRLAESQALARE